MHLSSSIIGIILGVGGIATPAVACVFDLPHVPVTLFANDSSGVIPREVYFPLYANSSDCLYRSRPSPTLPGKVFIVYCSWVS